MVIDEFELLLLHALPLDGTMWAAQMDLLPGATYAPTLYSLGRSIEEWAYEALKLTTGKGIVIVGCSVGGSCALEIAAIAPERVAALVLIGTKANHRPDPAFHGSALDIVRNEGIEAAWHGMWEPLFSNKTPSPVLNKAKQIALLQSQEDVISGITVFHTRPSRDHVLSSFQRPVIFVTGSDDVAPGLQTNARQAALAPHGRLHIIPECGHYLPLEQPAPLNAILKELIEEQQS